MLDLEAQLRRYGDALEAHQMDGVVPVDVERRPHRSRRFLGLVAVAAIALLVAVGIGAFAISSRGNRVRTKPEPATTAPDSGVALNRPVSLALASDGNLLIANQGTNQILRRPSTGELAVVAGTGTPGFAGDGHAATDAQLTEPHGIAVATDGTTYIADTGNARVRSITPDGIIHTVAGDGGGANGAPTTSGSVVQPWDVAVGPDGSLFVVDDAGVQRFAPDGNHTTVIGSGSVTLDGLSSSFVPRNLAVNSDGHLFVSDFSQKRLFEFSPTGQALKSWGPYVAGLAAGPTNAIYVADYGYAIDRADAGGFTPLIRFSLNSIPGITGPFRPSGVAVAPDGTIYASDDGVSSGASRPALISIGKGGQVTVLDDGTGKQPAPLPEQSTKTLSNPDGTVSVQAPAGWHVAARNLTPKGDRPEVIALGTYPLHREAHPKQVPGGLCDLVPIAALKRLTERDAFVWVTENIPGSASDTHSYIPPRPHFDSATGIEATFGDLSPCTGRATSRDGQLNFDLSSAVKARLGSYTFEEQGRTLLVSWVIGQRVSAARRQQVYDILNNLKIRPRRVAH
ncbi:MAG: repeat containing protein [Actinomycetia bacterium]|nr:repeat containing protein [Actinomycetes bacterium]